MAAAIGRPTQMIMGTMMVLVSLLILSVLETILITMVSSTIIEAMLFVQSPMCFP